MTRWNIFTKFPVCIVFGIFLLIGSANTHAVMPDLSTVTLDVDVQYNPDNGVYIYSYTVNFPATALGTIRLLIIDNQTINEIPFVSDPDLPHDGSMFLDNKPTRSVPVGVNSPTGWRFSQTLFDDILWSGKTYYDYLKPGLSLTGFKILSKAPPGQRKYQIKPIIPEGSGTPYHDECTESTCPPFSDFWKIGTTFGPVLPEEQQLIDGKGQRASDVNTFLRYSGIDTTTINLPAGTTSYDLAVRFGSTIDPNSFSSILNRQNITSGLFVYPDVTTVITLALQPGRNVLVLSVDGVRDDGRTATDTDRLVFIVQ